MENTKEVFESLMERANTNQLRGKGHEKYSFKEDRTYLSDTFMFEMVIHKGDTLILREQVEMFVVKDGKFDPEYTEEGIVNDIYSRILTKMAWASMEWFSQGVQTKQLI